MKNEVFIKMNADHAKEVVKILKKISNELYSGDDYESRSTIEERVFTMAAQGCILDGIERYEKRIKRAWQALFFLVLLSIRKTRGKKCIEV